MKNKLLKSAFPLMAGLFLACATATIVEVRLKVIQRAYDRFILETETIILPVKISRLGSK